MIGVLIVGVIILQIKEFNIFKSVLEIAEIGMLLSMLYRDTEAKRMYFFYTFIVC